ncbi:hypothetical protein L596_003831 [Steinernema carpocapsae]|uniref:Uncharacterized protein n=1 Tax=Steinernema carpocapsae TaxID=34508 RepID=A0A4U8UVH1_STECR|nr:hypothetical protein L596_003831 [Steinernema carpocapsae]
MDIHNPGNGFVPQNHKSVHDLRGCDIAGPSTKVTFASRSEAFRTPSKTIDSNYDRPLFTAKFETASSSYHNPDIDSDSDSCKLPSVT